MATRITFGTTNKWEKTMRYVTAAAFLLASAAPALAWGPLIEADAFDQAVAEADDPLIIDIRTEELFQVGHIPGAVNLPYAGWRGPQTNPGELVSIEEVEAMLESVGATEDQEVAIVYAGTSASDFGAAARVYWTLKSAGFDDLAILNGGQAAWSEATERTVASGLPDTERSELELSWSNQWTMDFEGVSDVVAGRSDAVLIDGRPHEFFRGEKQHQAAASPGTLQGALNLVNFMWFEDESPIVSPTDDDIARVRSIADENEGKPLVSFCNTGHWAATNWFAVSELAGVEDVKLYPESMVGWTLMGGSTVTGSN